MHGEINLLDLVFEPYLTENQIAARVNEMGRAIKIDLDGRRPVFISILSGSFVFAADLIRAVETDLEMAFVKLSSYAGTTSTGEIQTMMGLTENLEGRHIVVVEDIVDSGRTLHFFLHKMREKKPASLSVAAFLVKPSALQFDIEIKYKGFEIPNDFVVGYGLDYDGLGRNLPGLYQLKKG